MVQIKNPLTIVQGGGSLANYGSITYLDANNVEQTLTLATEDDYLELTIGGSGTDIVINGVTVNKLNITGVVIADGVQYVPNSFCVGCNNLASATIPASVHVIGYHVFLACDIVTASFALQNVHQIGDNFLQGNSRFNSPIVLPKVKEIGQDFLRGCTSLNSAVTINDSCEFMGTGFLRGCTAFTQSLSVPSSLLMSAGLVNPGGRFMQDCKNFVGPLVCNCPVTNFTIGSTDKNNMLATTDATAIMYTTGITLTGPYANDWKTALPDSSSSPYRKLVVGS